MERAQELASLIKRGENNKADALLCNIYNKNECRAYCVALEKILLTEVAKILNDSVGGFYMDCGKLKEALFSENPPTRKTVFDAMRDILRDAQQEDRERIFEKAAEYIRKNLSDSQLTVSLAAEYSGVSESVLIKIFRQHAGRTPGEYINSERVRKSLSYLENGDSVALASGKSGFSSPETYIRTFKKHMGTTPGLWKRNKLFL